MAAPEESKSTEAATSSSDGPEIQPAPENKEQDAKAKKKAAEEAAEAKRKAAEEAAEAKRRLLAEEEAKRRAAVEEARRVAEAKRQAELEELKKEASAMYQLDEKAVPQMTTGFVGLTQPVIDSCCSKLSELQSAQAELIELLAQEDRKVMTLPHMADVAQTLALVPIYTQRLLEMRQEMDAITLRVKNMRKRAAKLYTKKQQEDNTAAQRRQASLERERLLLAQQQAQQKP